ncbi:MAG: extracellular solute-binding protein [Fimbriimonadaceae bacterium]|nr:extracellular solute-binding protein [Fimbriimonadaceae bacterium]
MSPEVKKTRELVVWGVSIGADSKGQDAVIREFERRNPEVRVRLLSMGAGQMDPQKLMTSIVGNVAPDVINQDRFTISDWASRGAFRSLDDLIQRDRGQDPLTPTEDQYYEAPWEEAKYNGKTYAIPTGADNRILYWNKAVFREKAAELAAAGLSADRAPRTWSELLKYSEILTEKNSDGTLKRAGFLPNFGNAWLYMYAFMNNATFMSEDGRTCTMNTPEAAEALKFMVDGYEIVGGYENAKSFESGFLGNENDAFVIGKVAMKIDGDWILNTLSRYAPQVELGAAEPPVPDDRYFKRGRFANEKDTFVTWFGGFSLAIPRGARNVEDGWRYIKFATSAEGRLIEMRAQREWERRRGRAYIPRITAHRKATEAAFVEFKPGEQKFADALAMHVKMSEFGRFRPATFVGQALWSEHVNAMEAALYKKATPAAALEKGEKAVQRELNAFFEKERYPVVNLAVPAMIGLAVIIFMVGGFALWFSRLKLGRLERTEALWAYAFISPWIIGFVVLTVGPMVASLFFSFTQYDVLNEARWVGLKNYQDMFTADRANVEKAMLNAAYLAAIGVPLGLATGLAVALLLNTASVGMRLYRTMFYMPAIVPGVASAVLWTWVLTPDANKGIINNLWKSTITAWLMVPPPSWLNSADWSKNALILMGMWGAGSGMVLWLAGLKGISGSLYEASSLDGANPRQQFWSITFPQLSPIIFFNTVMGFIGAMQEFDRMYIMKPDKNGPIGPDDSLLTPVYHLFRNGFAFFKMGYASSLAWVIFAIIMLLTFVQFQLSSRWVHYETDK